MLGHVLGGPSGAAALPTAVCQVALLHALPFAVMPLLCPCSGCDTTHPGRG